MHSDDRLPHIVIGGAPRSGSTFLCEVLAKHPAVAVARPFIPEPKICMRLHPAGDEGYRADYARLFATAPPTACRIEKTSYYLENDDARARLARLLPDAKFVFILREPVARAHSNWRWSTRNGLETLPFAEAVAREGTRPSPLPPSQDYARPFDYMRRGRYATFAQAWINAVGRDRIAFHILEAVLAHPEPFVRNLQDFIGIPPLPWTELTTGRINAGDPDPAALPQDLVLRLRSAVRAEVLAFAALTGCDVGVWGY